MKKSLYIVSLFLMFIFQAEAKVLNVSYKVSFGVLGKLGTSEAHLETKGNRYTMDITMQLIGLAKTLSKDRKERHISKGHIVNGVYIADSYKVIKSYGKKYTEKLYTIHHIDKKVLLESIRIKNEKTKKESIVLDFYSKNDLLTLYFNLPKIFGKRSKPGSYKFLAVGAERQKGEVEIYLPKKSELKRYKKILGEGDYWYLTATIYQKIFASEKGELMLAIDKDGITQKAVLKDLILFGDLISERIN